MNENIKKFITCQIPVTICNFKCPYCYIDQKCVKNNQIVDFAILPAEFAKKFSPEKMGGFCYFNLCGNGETMIHPQVNDLVYYLTKEGHYCDIITNGTYSKKFDELLEKLSKEQQKHLFIKFSFHYLELKRLKLMEQFLQNVEKIKKSEVSYTIEITPYDDLIPYIDEIKKFSLDNFGALPHITVARNMATDKIEILTKLSKKDYYQIWKQFDSKMFEFKFSTFNVHRTEFCYAGEWSISIDLETGIYKQCYSEAILGNIKEESDIKFLACGKCREPHCYNGHAFLTFGDIPEMNTPTYSDMRDRITTNKEHWLKKDCRDFFSTKLYDNNVEYSINEQSAVISKTNRLLVKQKIEKIPNKIKNISKKLFNSK